MTNIITLFEEFGMTEKGAKAYLTRVKKGLDFDFGVEVDDKQLIILLATMSKGKYKDNASKKAFELKKKDYNEEIKQTMRYTVVKQDLDTQGQIPHNFKLLDSVFIDENRNRGMIMEKIVGNFATVEIMTGRLQGEVVKIKVDQLTKREPGQR